MGSRLSLSPLLLVVIAILASTTTTKNTQNTVHAQTTTTTTSYSYWNDLRRNNNNTSVQWTKHDPETYLIDVALLDGGTDFVDVNVDGNVDDDDFFNLTTTTTIESSSSSSSPSSLSNMTGNNVLIIRLADVPAFLPFSESGKVRTGIHNDAAATLLAMRHFNERKVMRRMDSDTDADADTDDDSNDGAIVQLSEEDDDNAILQDCNIYMTLQLWDTGFSPIAATRIFTQEIWSRPHSLEEPKPAAVMGAFRSATTSPLAILTGVYDIPQISGSSTSTDFDIKEQFPRFGQTIGSSNEEAMAALELYQTWNVTHVALLFVTDAYGSALQKSFQDAATDLGLVVDSIALSFSATDAEITVAIANLRQTEFRHFYAICFETHYMPIMKAAYDAKLTGPGFSWLFPGLDTFSFFELLNSNNNDDEQGNNHKGEWLRQATDGMGILQYAGGFTPDPYLPGVERNPPVTSSTSSSSSSYERFRTAWRQSLQDEEWVAYVRSQYPTSLTESSVQGWDPMTDFSLEPTMASPYLYDAIFAIGLSMCRASATAQTKMEEAALTGDPVKDTDGVEDPNRRLLSGTDIYAEFLQLEFYGASGFVTIDNTTGSRERHPYVLNNVRFYEKERKEDGAASAAAGTTNGYAIYPTAVLDEETGLWVFKGDFVFSDGTKTPPDSLPPVQQDMNYIGNVGRAIGYTLMGLVLLSTLLCWMWLGWNRNERVVESSQPTSLLLVSVGAFIMAFSILPMGWEETTARSLEGLDKACQAVPWLYVVGTAVAFSALFAKTRAIYKAYNNPDLEFIVVTPRDMLQMLGFLFLVNAILLAAWTAIAPLEWDRHIQDATDTFGRPVESYGGCSNGDTAALVLVILLAVFNLGLLLMANFCAYQARNIETEYHESRYTAIAMASVLQAWCMGIPILIMVWTNPQAKFFVGTGIVFVTSSALLGLVYVPKMIAISQDRKHAAEEKRKKAFRKFAEKKVKGGGENHEPDGDDGSNWFTNTPEDEAAMRASRGNEQTNSYDDWSAASSKTPKYPGHFINITTAVTTPQTGLPEESPKDQKQQAPSQYELQHRRQSEPTQRRQSGIKILHNPRASWHKGTAVPVFRSDASPLSRIASNGTDSPAVFCGLNTTTSANNSNPTVPGDDDVDAAASFSFEPEDIAAIGMTKDTVTALSQPGVATATVSKESSCDQE